ncbi:MAG: ECF transporter S component [Oscillospiraceae bacterium]|jgi:uncharacterized membrane protein|nr:ECF transporter S component [Oscillospiraceae bacterium]
MSKTETQTRTSAKKFNVVKLVQLSILVAVEMLLFFTPLGYIPLGFMRATTMHIPVILAAIAFGPAEGAFMGFVFGLTSFLKNTLEPTITSFVFTPFYSFSADYKGNFWSIFICFAPRILIGVVAACVYRALVPGPAEKPRKLSMTRSSVALVLAGVAGSLTNTVLVMSGICVFFGKQYASATGRNFTQLLSYVVTSVVGVNGVIEAISAGIIILIVGRAILAFLDRRQKAE